MTFQTEFVKLRGQFLEAIFNVVVARNTQSITPPPAIAQTLAQNSRDHLQKYGHVTNQLRKSVKILKSCEMNYLNLYKSAFDADPCTLEILELHQHIAGIIGYSVETICFVTPSDIPIIPTVGHYPESLFYTRCSHQIMNELEKLPAESGNIKSISNKHTDVILNQIETLTRTQNCLPRFFFQVLQNTSIKLSVSPQPRALGEPAIVQPGSNLIVKVEGVIQHYGHSPNLYRSIDQVQLTLTSHLLSMRPNDIKMANDTTVLTQSVKPHRDFLSGSFLLPLSTQVIPSKGGQWQVLLEACVIDEDGVVWNTGPKSSLTVRIPDDPNSKSFPDANQRRPYNY